VIEAVALGLVRRPLAFGAVAGLGAGTIGFAGEWPWVNAVYPIHWNANLLPEGLVIAAIAGIAGGLLGALFGPRPAPPAAGNGPGSNAKRVAPRFARRALASSRPARWSR